MTLVNLEQVLEPARAEGRGLAAFNVIQIEHAEAYAVAAEKVGLPVVMQISRTASATTVRSRRFPLRRWPSQPPATSRSSCTSTMPRMSASSTDAVRLGLTSVMYDGSRLSDAANRAQTRRVVELCHAHAVSVEAELGEVGGKDGVHTPGARTDPAEAARFVADTGVDALAVAVGSSHAMTDRTALLDTDLIGALKDSVPVPLVLHGSSGVADDGLAAAVRAGMTKVNIATHLNQVFTRAMLGRLESAPTVDTRTYLGAARDAVADEAARLMRLLATA